MGTGVEGKERNAGQNRGQTTPFTVRSPPFCRVAYVEPAFLLLRLFRHLPYTRANRVGKEGEGGELTIKSATTNRNNCVRCQRTFLLFRWYSIHSYTSECMCVCVFVLGGCVRRESCVHNARAAYFVQTFFAFLFSCHLSVFLSPSLYLSLRLRSLNTLQLNLVWLSAFLGWKESSRAGVHSTDDWKGGPNSLYPVVCVCVFFVLFERKMKAQGVSRLAKNSFEIHSERSGLG